MAPERTVYCVMETPLGKALAAAEGDAVTGFWFYGQRYFPGGTNPGPEPQRSPAFSALRNWLEGYFAGGNPERVFPLAPRGTPFQKAVWDILLRIPYGTLTTYGAIARRLNERRGEAATSARAVGGAVGHNPVSVLIPCHRVVGATGKLTGYAGGLDKKKALLRLEGALL